MHQFAAAIPQRRPLGTHHHAVVTENGVHMPDWVLEYNTRVKRPVFRIQPIGKAKRAKHRIWVGGGSAFKARFNRQGDVRGGSDGRRV